MKQYLIFVFSLLLICCSPKGPQTFSSPFIGKTKTELIAAKGTAKRIKVFDKAEAYIYITKEEYFGKKVTQKNASLTPKKTYEIEHIYYINEKGSIYKYQVWKKKVK